MSRSADQINGVLLLDKPTGITSHDAVQKVRKLVGQRRVGHTGTLDPDADGLLVMCLGTAAKIARFLSDMDKTYHGTITLGRTSSTYDSEGVDRNVPAVEVPDLSRKELEKVLSEFTGQIRQQVPAYSAVRVDGQRLYELARKGADVTPPEREVIIKSIRVLDYASPDLSVEVVCSKGTYIRSLAHDIGKRLGCGGYLSRLRRVAVGHLSLERAVTIDELSRLVDENILHEKLIPLDEALGYGALLVENGFKDLVLNGRDLRVSNVTSVQGDFAAGDNILLKDSRGLALAVGVAEVDSQSVADLSEGSKLFKYVRVLN